MGCGKSSLTESAGTAGHVVLYGDQGPVGVRVEIVSTAEEMQEGLMYRSSLPDQHGMLFLFESSHLAGFWMKNTLIPLDIIMIDKDWDVAIIHHNVPPCEADPCEHYYAETPVKYVLETNGGFAEKWGIGVGTGVVLGQAAQVS